MRQSLPQFTRNCAGKKPSFEEKTRFQRSRVTCGKNYSAWDNGALSSNTRHGAPLERGDLDLSYSTDMAILWIEKQVLLVERIIPTGIMARSQVTLLRETVVSDELKPMKSRHRDREITPTVYTELRREETEF